MNSELVRAAHVAIGKRDFAGALAIYERALAAQQDDADALHGRALALAGLGRIDDALAAARICLAQRPGHQPALELIDHLDSVQPARSVGWAIGSVVADRWEVFGGAEGGMGRVHFVRDREWNGMELAVKTLLPRHDLAEDEQAKARALFRRETQTWLDLGAHPHVVTAFYTLELDGALRFFMERVPGCTLAEVIAAGRIPIAQAFDFAIQIAAALEHVHARGVVHRDLKPANCLVDDGGVLRVTDFGLSKAVMTSAHAPELELAATFDRAFTVPGAGTPLYMAPEQWRHEITSTAADVYATGLILYELATGARVFDVTRSSWERYVGRVPHVLAQLIRGPDPIPTMVLRMLHEQVAPELAPDLPPVLRELVARCLDKVPERRPSVADLKAGLVEIYRRVTGHDYARPLFGALAPNAVSETNRAASYYTMGDTERARHILDAWLATDPTALHAWIDRAVIAINDGAEPAPFAVDYLTRIKPAHPFAAETDNAVARFEAALLTFGFRAPGTLHDADFSPDGRRIVLATSTEHPGWHRKFVAEAHIWDCATARRLVSFVGRSADEGFSVPVPELLFTGGGLLKFGVVVADLESGAVREGIDASAARPRDQQPVDVVPASGGVAIRLRGTTIRTLEVPAESVVRARMSPDGTRLLTMHHDGFVRIWPADSTWRPQPAWTPVNCRDLPAEARRYLALEVDQQVSALERGDLDAFRSLGRARARHEVYRRDLPLLEAMNRFGARHGVWVGYDDLWLHTRIEVGDTATAMCFTEDGQRLLIATSGGELQIWNVRTALRERVIAGVGTGAKAVQMLRHDGARDHLVMMSNDRVTVWTATGQLLSTLEPRRHSFYFVTLSSDGSLAFGYDPAGAGIIYSVESGEMISTPDSLDPQEEPPVAVFSPDNRELFVAITWRTLGAIQCWDVRSGHRRGAFAQVYKLMEAVGSLDINSDGRYLLLGSGNWRSGAAISFETGSRRMLTQFHGHSQVVTAATFGTHDATVLTGDGSGNVALWTAGGELVKRLEGHHARIRNFAVAPTGILASIDANGSACLWFLESRWKFLEEMLEQVEGLLEGTLQPRETRQPLRAIDNILGGGGAPTRADAQRERLDFWIDLHIAIRRCMTRPGLPEGLVSRGATVTTRIAETAASLASPSASITSAAVQIPRAVLDQVYAQARRAAPACCCGWLAGAHVATAVRPATNRDPQPDHNYSIGEADLVAFARSFAGAEPPLIVYNSRWGPRAYFSEVDRRSAASPTGDPSYPVQYLVVAVGPGGVCESRQYAWNATFRAFVEVAAHAGDSGNPIDPPSIDIVTIAPPDSAPSRLRCSRCGLSSDFQRSSIDDIAWYCAECRGAVLEAPVLPPECRLVHRMESERDDGIYLVDHLLHGRVVLKLAIPRGPVSRKQRLQDAEARPHLDHPHIVRTFDVREYAPGVVGTLLERMDRNAEAMLVRDPRGIDPRVVIHIASQVLDALAHAHDQCILHRNLKLSNILVRDVGLGIVAKLSDFCAARDSDDNDDERFPAELLHYAPERIFDSRRLGPPTELYEVGALLYRLLTGMHPFDFSPDVDPLVTLLEAPIVPIRTRYPGIPGPLAAAVERALARDPHQRYRDAREMRIALRATVGPYGFAS